MLRYRLFILALFFGFVMGCQSGTKITSVEPNFGNVAGNDDVVIQGNGFKPGMVVRFGKNEVKNVIIDSPTQVRIKTPSGVEGKVDVIIILEDGNTLMLKNGFTYTSAKATGS